MSAFESKKYSWNVNMNVPAQTVGTILERIEQADGVVTKEAFLEASRPAGSPTHCMFEWDDTVAAEEYRLYQARHIITNLRVCIVENEENSSKFSVAITEQKTQRAFVNIAEKAYGNKGSYSNIETALGRAETRNIVLQNAINELKSFQEKYRTLTELSEILKVINKYIEERETA